MCFTCKGQERLNTTTEECTILAEEVTKMTEKLDDPCQPGSNWNIIKMREPQTIFYKNRQTQRRFPYGQDLRTTTTYPLKGSTTEYLWVLQMEYYKPSIFGMEDLEH
ncbi:hypothetical protein GE061_000435 [Apolygus lucorum]|uniref:Uncharacterized protein n=1 Tax=Apolygus lucorum TaxID=248454 RepID=A0A8S9Y4B9_APOLU|nr:hypothetical protein GE061_000435 [Apolygus lucorum]